MEWPFGPPILRTAMMGYTIYDDDGYPIPRPLDNAPDVIEISLHELRRRRRENRRQYARPCRRSCAPKRASRCQKLSAAFATRRGSPSSRKGRERAANLLRATGLPPAAMKKLVLGAPSLLLHTNLNETLAEKLRVLTSATGSRWTAPSARPPPCCSSSRDSRPTPRPAAVGAARGRSPRHPSASAAPVGAARGEAANGAG